MLQGASLAAEPYRMPEVIVVGATPLPGVDLSLDDIAAPVQTATAADIERSHALDLAGYMNRNLGSVHINDD